MVLACLAIAYAQSPCRPYSEEQIVRLLTGSVTPRRVQQLVGNCGVEFALTPQVEARLRRAGATDEVVAAVRRRGEAPKPRSTPAPRLGGFVMEFVGILPGEFMMGCANCGVDETPAHRVRITRGFQMGKYEVTQAQWETVMGTNPSEFYGVDRPVEMVSWDDAQVFLNRLNQRNDGYHYRLPTEAEWEYAARAGSSGNQSGPLAVVAWYSSNSRSQTHPIGQKQANDWGLHDMQGNVSEWCRDWYDPEYYGRSPVENPSGPSSGQFRVLRGGSCYNFADHVRVSNRLKGEPGARDDGVGLRCVREMR